ncbi:helix-turn-helix domain-containing protein [Nitrogeniibacter aestuarii]|uniref:helix-turn-helix domain-containing protein n=1 Tax=Nitrogeniibacter aestuarii TaxID=2815343 RepID=UPI001D113069|nr:helix-turn-helix domain-containing protein [Nitrogeniibacter aestuarii]
MRAMNRSASQDLDEWRQDSLARLGGQRFCTAQQAAPHRLEWLKEVIGREYANVEITPPKDRRLYNDMWIYPGRHGMRLSPIRSNPIALERLPQEPSEAAQDCYFAVVLTAGRYRLAQGGREVFLKPGEMSFYDATQPHRIEIPSCFSKILISIPRALLRQRVRNPGDLTATPIGGGHGIAAVASTLIRSTAQHLGELGQAQFLDLSEQALDLFALAINDANPQPENLSRHRGLALARVKQFIACHFADPQLDAAAIAHGVGLSARYINELFAAEGTSTMRHLTRQRLEASRRRLASCVRAHDSVTTIAMGCGFNNMAHFSRVFRAAYGVSPGAFRTGNHPYSGG